MAIDLPPPLPPQLTIPVAILEASQTQGAYIRRLGDYAIQVSGDHHLSHEELDSIFAKAATPSEAIVAMNAWTHRRGYLLVQYLYSRPINGVIHVRAVQKSLGSVTGDVAISQHFKPLEADQTPTRAEFVKHRATAQIVAERRGLNYSTSYRERPDDRDTLDLVFSGEANANDSRWHGSAQLGNQGSRFVGRYFANASLGRDFDSGLRVNAAYQTAIPEWGEAGDGDDFSSVQFKLNQATRFGIYELDAQQTEYERELTLSSRGVSGCALPLVLGQCVVPTNTSQSTSLESFSAEITQLAVRGQQVIKADVDHLWFVSQQIQWIDSSLDPATGEALQDERYSTLQIGTGYEKAVAVDDKTLRWKLAAAIRGGVSGDSGTLGSDTSSEGVSIGKRTSEFLMFRPSLDLAYDLKPTIKLTATLNGQFASDQLPQQQQWVLGGINKMRAYLPGALVGDSGVYASANLIHSLRFESFTLDTRFFAEYGSARYEDAKGRDFSGEVSLGSNSSIADAGVSLTLQAWEHLELSAVAARPVSKSNINKSQLEQTEADFFITAKLAF